MCCGRLRAAGLHNVDDKGCFAEFCDFGIDRVLARRHLALTAAPYDTPVALAAMNMIRNVPALCSAGLSIVLAISFGGAYGFTN